MSGNDHEIDSLLDAGLRRYSAVEPPADLENRLLAALKDAAKGEGTVDELLGVGLARYSAEPRPGLENRILAGLRAQPRASPWLNWRWVGAMATAAVAVVMLAVYFSRQPVPEPPPPAVATAPVPEPVPMAGIPKSVVPAAMAKPSVRRVQPQWTHAPRPRLPRRPTFPSPAPLSEQERLLLRYVQSTPEDQLVALQLGASPIARLDFEPVLVPRLANRESPLDEKEND